MDALEQVQAGRFDIVLPGLGRKDEIGTMVEAVQVYKDNMIKTDKMETEQYRDQATRTRRQEEAVEFLLKRAEI